MRDSVSAYMAVQVAYLFRHTILKGLEPAGGEGKDVDLDYRFVVFACLDPICADGQLLMDLFVNFDCDPDRTDTVLLERLFKLLSSCITNPDALHDASGNSGALPQAQRNLLRYAALKCLCQALHSLFQWHEQLSGAGLLPCVGLASSVHGFRSCKQNHTSVIVAQASMRSRCARA